jgi:putative oxidoreductase
MGEAATGLGYLLLGGVFVFAGIDHFLRFEAVRRMLADRSWPRPGAVLAVASVFQIVAGLCLALGLLRPWAALGLAAFTVAATLLLLDFWKFQGPPRDGMRSGFTVNVALVGGLLLAFGQSL